jgi:predicted transcriptional regulator
LDKQIRALKFGKRRRIYSLIRASPGLHFREIQRRTDLATGQLGYHLEQLHKAGLIQVARTGEYVRYYTDEEMEAQEKNILEHARQKSVRHILLLLLDSQFCKHERLVEGTGLSPSTVSWHLMKLTREGIVDRQTIGRKSCYSLRRPELVMNTLVKHRESFLDRMVNHFIEMWRA